MATKKIKESTTINVTAKTKDTTYIIDKNVADSVVVNFNTLEIPYFALPTKKDSADLALIVPTDVNEMTLTYKYGIMTIKDYYKYAETNTNLIKVKDSSIYETASANISEYLRHGKVEGDIGSVIRETVISDKKATTYNITQSEKGGQIYDLGGNDKYTLSAAYVYEKDNYLMIEDFVGKDKYTFKNGNRADLEDYGGNDTFKVYEGSNVSINNFNGNDNYTSTGSIIKVNDIQGKDSYNFVNNTAARIMDCVGNDKYVANNVSTLSIKDYCMNEAGFYSGNDKYTITNAEYLTITDESGNDTYKLTNVQTVADEDNESNPGIADYEGNDKYTISSTLAGVMLGINTDVELLDASGKDTYNIKGTYDKKTKITTYVNNVIINDKGAEKNTFNLNYAGYTSITTESGTNVYNIKNSDHVVIESNAEGESTGSDKYTLTSNNYFDIEDYGATSDSYNMTKSWTGEIDDRAGNDTYTIDSLQLKPYDSTGYRYAGITIYDKAGDNDSLVLKGTKADNIVFMSDFYYDNADEKYESSGNSLILYDKSTGGYTYITDFYKSDSTSRDFDGFGVGLIETIKASKKKLDVSTNTEYYTKMNAVKEEVVTWLTSQTAQGFDGNFSYVEDVLKFGTNAQKADLVAFFDQSGK